MLLTKKGVNRMGSQINDAFGSGYSDFARKQMEKYG